jgi:hypothetical protein
MKETLGGIVVMILTILIFVFFTQIVGLIVGDSGSFLLLLFAIFLFAVSAGIAHWIYTTVSKAPKIVLEKIQDLDYKMKLKKELLAYDNVYLNAKHSYQFLSNETLLSKRMPKSRIDETNFLEQLALEELLVERGILEYSPLHEDLHAIKQEGKNEASK